MFCQEKNREKAEQGPETGTQIPCSERGERPWWCHCLVNMWSHSDLVSGSAALPTTITTSGAAGQRKPPEHRQFTTIASSSSFPTHERQRTRNVEGECTFPSPKRSHLWSNLGQKKASPQPLNDTADPRAPKAHVNTWVVLLHLLLLLPPPAGVR